MAAITAVAGAVMEAGTEVAVAMDMATHRHQRRRITRRLAAGQHALRVLPPISQERAFALNAASP